MKIKHSGSQNPQLDRSIVQSAINALALCLLCTGLLALPAHAQSVSENQSTIPNASATYPNRPLHLVVPFPAGGGNDFIARFLAQRLQLALKQAVIVDNKAGAGGLLGNEYALQSAGDGYTLLLASASYTVNAALYPLKYDPLQDVSAIAQLSQGAFVLVANPSLKAKNISELLALAKAHPREINIASSGEGSILHLSAELLMNKAAIELTHIPYKGGAQALSDTVAGQTQLFFSTPSVALPFIKTGKLKALGVSTLKRTSALADTPTLHEAGVTGYEVNVWHGILAPKGVPIAIITKLNAEINTAMNSKEAQELLEKDGVYPMSGTPEQFQNLLKREITAWREVVKKANIQIHQ
jgi:tripartite-type tricarboxylate transporter receptor subunit TctC